MVCELVLEKYNLLVENLHSINCKIDFYSFKTIDIMHNNFLGPSNHLG